MLHIPALVVALAQAPASAPAAPGLAGAVDNVARLRDHLQSLVDTRAARLGGPKFAEDDQRLGTLRAMLRTVAARPEIPVPDYVLAAKTLEDLWGGSSAVFATQLMVQVAQARPSGQATPVPMCQKMCSALTAAAGDDTVTGLTRAGWPMPPDSAAVVRMAAANVTPACVAACGELQVPNVECAAAVKTPGDLMRCWKAPEPPK